MEMCFDDLTEVVNELQNKDPEIVIRLFKTKNAKNGNLIAHYANGYSGVLKVMQNAMENLSD